MSDIYLLYAFVCMRQMVSIFRRDFFLFPSKILKDGLKFWVIDGLHFLLFVFILQSCSLDIFAQTIVPCSNPRYAPKCIGTLSPVPNSYSAFYEDGYVYSGGNGQIIKYNVSDVNNLTKESLVDDPRIKKVYDIVSSGRYLYAMGRIASTEVYSPTICLKFDDAISNFKKKLGEFDSISTFEGINVTEDGEYSPMTYYNGKSLRFVSKSGSGSARLYKKLGDVVNEGEVSFSIKNTLSANTEISIPILSLNGENKMSIKILQNTANEHRITFTGEEGYGDISIPSNEWYQVKIHFDSQKIILYYRPKECGDWIHIYEKVNDDNFAVNELVVGVSDLANGDEVLMDDFCYDKGNLDDVSYAYGTLTVADKITGEVYNVYHYDMKGTGVDVCDNILAVSGFCGVNIYDISNPTVPKLIWWHKEGKAQEHHRCKIFTANDGRKYLIVCKFLAKYLLYDITDLSNIRYINSYSFRPFSVDGKEWLSYSFTIDYPYAYFPLSASKHVLGTENDHRGVMAVDLSDVLHPVFSFGEIPVDALTYPTSGDPRPTKIAKYKNKLFVNNANRGVIMLDVTDPMAPLYQSNITVNTQKNTNDVCVSPDGHIFCTDEYGKGGLNVIYSEESPWAEEMKYSLNISDAKWATLCLPFSFQIPENTHFFTVNEGDGDDLSLNEVNYAEANTPYLVKGHPGTYNLSGIVETASGLLSNGLLVGSYDELYAPIGSYVLQKINNDIGFYSVTKSNIKIPAYRAYLSLSGTNYNSSQRILLNFEDAISVKSIVGESVHGKIISVLSVDGRKKVNDCNGVSIIVYEDGFRKKNIK